MFKYTVRRILQSIPLMFGITIIAYAIMALAPGGPTRALTFDPNMTVQQREALVRAMGENDPIPVQYFRWLIGTAPIEVFGVEIWGGRELPVFDRRGNEIGTQIGTDKGVLRGDLGHSVQSGKPVVDAIWERIPATLELGWISLLVGLLIGIPIGVLAAVNRGGWFDQITRVLAVFISSVPVFWLGLVLLLLFGSWLGWLPMGNRFPLSFSGEYSLMDRAKHLVLPVVTLSSFTVATFSRYMRASLLEVLNSDYVRTARSKGLNKQRIYFVHALRNALIPIATLIGPAITGVIAGAILTETIYSWPGMGRLIVVSVSLSDYPVIMAIVLLFAVATIIGYLISDLLYGLIDPRVRLD